MARWGLRPRVTAWLDDGLALLFQQGDEPLFGADVAADELVGVVEVADDGGLFVEWWKVDTYVFNLRLVYGRDWTLICDLTKIYAL